MLDFSAIGQLLRLEFRKVFKSKAIYIVLGVMVVFGGLIATNNRSGEFPSEEDMMRQELSRSLSILERGEFAPVAVFFQNGSTFGPPPGIDPTNKPLKDQDGALIPENVEYYKQYYTDYVEEQIAKLPESRMDPLGTVMGQTASQVANMIPMLGVALAVGLFAGDFRGGYRLMISRGVRRNNLMTAKLLATLGLALLMAAVFTGVMLLGSLGATSGSETTVSASIVLNVFGVALLMFVAYMLVGGLVGTILASSGSAMGVGLVLAFISSSFFFNLTPKDDFFLAFMSPASLGYNFNSLMYYVLRAGEESDRYRGVAPSIAVALTYAGVYAGVIYSVFSKKQLRG